MKKQAVTRDYNFSDSDLYAQAAERLQYLRRDAKEFAAYGYEKSKIDAYEALCKRLSEQTSDDELVGEQMLATQKKNDAAERLKTAIRSVMTRVASKYPINGGHYRKFGTTKMNDMNDPKLLLCGRRVARVAEKLLDFLAETGLKQTHIDNLRQAANEFENALNVQQDKVSDRDIAVEARVEIANELYNEMVLVCNIGKDIWAETNKTKYENYTIYESNNDQKKARKEKERAKTTEKTED